MAKFYVYENWRRKRGRIHLAACPHCNDGRGTQPADSGENGKWHGPYFERQAAIDVAKKLKGDIQPCIVCKP